MLFPIGSVVFAHDDDRRQVIDGTFVGLSGEERVKMLRLFYRHQLPEGWRAVADAYSGNRELTWYDVNWSTAGPAVTE